MSRLGKCAKNKINRRADAIKCGVVGNPWIHYPGGVSNSVRSKGRASQGLITHTTSNMIRVLLLDTREPIQDV